MAQTPLSLLLAKRLSLSFHFRKASTFFFLSHLLRPFSTSQTLPSTSSSDPKPSSLSARMSFIFDQIDSIEKERSQKDQTLQRIRAWRENKKSENASLEARKVAVPVGNENRSHVTEPELELDESKGFQVAMKNKEVELVHPWPEWIEFLERLVQQNYFDHKRKDEDKMVQELGYDPAEVAFDNGVGTDFLKDFKTVHTACLNFGKDRFDLLRSLSRQDIQILVGYGCPNVDKKVVFSAKLLRKYVHLDEGDVCSSCSLRNSCERAYLITNKEDEARTIDVIRVLLTYGFDPWNGSVVNDSLLKKKSVKTVVRKLLHGVVKLSSVPIDPNLPFPVIKRPPPKVKQPPPPPRKRVGRDDIEMKKGDWLCPKCDFMNFSKNTVCLQCDAKRPKRQLLPGEWECPECNFLNYRRNVVCFHCECKRPLDEYMENKMDERQQGPRTRLEKIASRKEVSNAWNFDFDDNESDGADVAAFEYADSSVRGGISSVDDRVGGNLRKFDDNLKKVGRGLPDGEFSDAVNNRPGMGFDDFEDEEDDIESYEPVTPSNSEMRSASIDFSDVEGSSESEDVQDYNHNVRAHGKLNFSSNNKQSKIPQGAAFSESEGDEFDIDSDEEHAVGRKWKSSHVSDSRQKSRGSGSTSRSRNLRYGSDEDLGLYSDVDEDSSRNFVSRKNNGGKMTSSGRDVRGRRTENENRFSSDSDIDGDDRNFGRRKLTGNNRESGRRNDSKSRGGYNKFSTENESRSPNVRSRRMDNYNNDLPGSHASGRRFSGSDRGGQRAGSDRGGQRARSDWGGQRAGSDRGGQRAGSDRGGQRAGSDRGGQSANKYRNDFSGNGKPLRMQRQQRPDDRDWGKNIDDSQFRNSRRVIER